jgi:hypothetical protein
LRHMRSVRAKELASPNAGALLHLVLKEFGGVRACEGCIKLGAKGGTCPQIAHTHATPHVTTAPARVQRVSLVMSLRAERFT